MKRLVGFAPAAVWALTILWLGSQPSLRSPVDFPYVDKAAHFSMFALLGALIGWGLHRASVRASIAWPLVAGSLVGVLDELHQRTVPGRSSDLKDLLADALGCAVGLWLTHWWFDRRITKSATHDTEAGRRKPDDGIREHSA